MWVTLELKLGLTTQLSLRRTPLGPALYCVHLKEMSVLKRVK